MTLSVVCSNIRLLASHPHDQQEDVRVELKEERWVKLFIERATQAVKNIHNSSHSSNLDASKDNEVQNGHSNVDSEDDVKWMETVNMIAICFELSRIYHLLNSLPLLQLFHFLISSMKSGRSSHLLDVIVGLLYPVISLQVCKTELYYCAYLIDLIASCKIFEHLESFDGLRSIKRLVRFVSCVVLSP